MSKKLLFFVTLFAIGVQAAMAQTKAITGTVISSEDGLSIPGASVVAKATTVGTITDFDGLFSLEVPESTTHVVVSFVGMQAQEVALTGASDYNITLEPENIAVGEVVVTALGISREKKALGYSVQNVDGDKIAETKESNVVAALSGKVAGVTVSGSGNMGGSSRIVIRGASSVTGNNQPLFVVDGVPIDNSSFNSGETNRGGGGVDYGNMAQDINPDDIETMSVLKGPAAAALYGSRAANGVVMITTKKGTKRKGIGVTVSTGVTIQKINRLPEYQNTYGGGMGDFDEIDVDGDGTIDGQAVSFGVDESWGPKYEGQMVYHWDYEDNMQTREWKAPENDVEDFFETGVTYNNSVALAGGNEEANFRLGFTSMNTDGYMPNSEMDRYAINFGGSAKLTEELTINGKVNYVQTAALGRATTGYDSKNVMQQFTQWGQRQLDMDRLAHYKNADGSQRAWNRTSQTNGDAKYSDNPYWVAHESYNQDLRDRFYGNVGLSYKVNENISTSFKVYKDFYTFRMEDRIAMGSSGTSGYSEDVKVSNENNFEWMTNFNKQLNDEWNVHAMAGWNYRVNSYESNYGTTQGGLAIPNVYVLTNSTDAVYTEDYESRKEVVSAYGTMGAGWKNMLYVDATFRNDWTSTLPSANRSFFYPSVTTSLVMTELEPFKDLSWFSFGKIRAGWSMVGNDTDPYKLKQTYTYSNSFDGTPRYSVPSSMPNENLKPETTYSWELGAELRFLKNRLNVDFTYYEARTEDLITELAVSGSTGYDNIVTNGGAMENRGIELMVNAVPVQTNDFTWDVTMNLAKNSNKLIELTPGIDNYRLANAPFNATVNAFVGESYGVIMGTDFVYDANGNKVVGANGRYLETQDAEILGEVNPDFTLGISNSFSYKGFTFGALIDIKQGGNYFSTSNMFGMYSGMLEGSVYQDGVDIREHGITIDGVYGKFDNNGVVQYINADGSDSEVAVKNDTNISGQTWSQDHYQGPDAQNVFDASYVKLREVTFGYTFPSEMTGPIQNLNVSLYGRNLATWGLDNPDYDPDAIVTGSGNVQGIEGAAHPGTANYGVNVKFKF